ncbi:protein ripply2 isoform X2 [Bubalus kerabau]|uniref:protein ripply2 isoform X2 n=1 Tax=Bubalus carabanensis TaxID=3119969 RepID=UPI00244E9FE2|nr:protein ripply2 isoform X2 [Bubalus carabanensis]
MEIAKRTESRSGQCVHLCRPPPAPDLPMQHRGADSGYRALAPPRAYPAPSLPPAPSRLLPSDFPAPHPPRPGSAAVRSPGYRFASSLRVLCSPPRRSAVFWRPWIDDGGEKEQEAPHHAVEAMPDGPGITDASGKLSQYRHPVRIKNGVRNCGLQQTEQINKWNLRRKRKGNVMKIPKITGP